MPPPLKSVSRARYYRRRRHSHRARRGCIARTDAASIKANIVSDRTPTKTASKSAKYRQQIGGDENTVSRSKRVST